MIIRTLREFAGIPAGTRGSAERDGGKWKISWHSRSLVDWFNDDEFKLYLEVVTDPITVDGYTVIEETEQLTYGCPVKDCPFTDVSAGIVEHHLHTHKAIIKLRNVRIVLQKNKETEQ